MYEQKLLATPEVFNCPGGRAHPRFNYESMPKPFLSDLTDNYRSSYSYNPHYALKTPGDPTSPRSPPTRGSANSPASRRS
jgi:hypothetical protein